MYLSSCSRTMSPTRTCSATKATRKAREHLCSSPETKKSKRLDLMPLDGHQVAIPYDLHDGIVNCCVLAVSGLNGSNPVSS